MNPSRVVRAAALVALASLPLGACKLNQVRGAGPVTRERVAHMLEDVEPEDARKRADALTESMTADEEIKEGMRTVYESSGFIWPLLAGPWQLDGYHVPQAFDSETDREFLSQVRMGGLLAPLVYGHVITTFDDVETGTQVSSVKSGGLPLLYLRSKSASPVGFSKAPDRRLLQKRYPLEQAPYEYENKTDVVMGLLGWGERNRTSFMKLLFIEIPLWTDE